MSMPVAARLRRFPGLWVMGMLVVVAAFLLVTDAGCFWQDVCHFGAVETGDDACGATVVVSSQDTRLTTHLTAPLPVALLSCCPCSCPVPTTWAPPRQDCPRPGAAPFRACLSVRGPPSA